MLPRGNRMLAGGIAPRQIIGDVASADDDAVTDEVPHSGAQRRLGRKLSFESAAGTQTRHSIRVGLDRLKSHMNLVAIRRQIESRWIHRC